MTESAIDHPLRHPMVAELHARPSAGVSAPCTVVYLAFKEPQDAAGRDRARDVAHLTALAALHGDPAPVPEREHFSGRIGGVPVRWESHTEYVRYAAYLPGLAERPFDPAAALRLFPPEWQAAAPGRLLVAALVEVAPMPDDPGVVEQRFEQCFARDALATAEVLDKGAVIAGDFRIDDAGWTRFKVFARPAAGPGRLGRLVQRLLELETYRALAMLGLPRARALSARLNTLEPRLTALVEAMSDDARPPEAALHDLLDLSAQLESAATQLSFRFGATAAYQALVEDRLAALREERMLGKQSLSEFMARRFEPAMRTVRSAEARVAAMLDRAGRAGELLRTRVDVGRQAQSQALLSSMDRRAELQLRLQHTVEGLSVVAISYYAVGLLGYAVYPLAHAFEVDKAAILAGLVPVVLLCVWLGMRRIRARLHDDSGGPPHHAAPPPPGPAHPPHR